MALDGKITANELALARHLDIIALTNNGNNLSPQKKTAATQIDLSPTIKTEQWLNWQDQKGKIAIICNNLDLAVITWDLLCQGKGKPACCVLIDNSQYSSEDAFISLQEQLAKVLQEIYQRSGIKVVLVNILAEEKVNSTIAQTIIESYQPLEKQIDDTTGEERNLIANGAKYRSRRQVNNQSNSQLKQIPSVKIVVRLLDREIDYLPEDIPENLLYWTDNLQEAVQKAISFGKSR